MKNFPLVKSQKEIVKKIKEILKENHIFEHRPGDLLDNDKLQDAVEFSALIIKLLV